MSFMENVRNICSGFNSVSPLSAVTREDVENCRKLTEATGITWTPVQALNPLMLGSNTMRHVFYHGHLYDKDDQIYAMRFQDIVNEASKSARPEGAYPNMDPYVTSQMDVFGTPYVYIERTEFGGADELANRLSSLDPDKLKSEIAEGFARADKYVQERDAVAGIHKEL